MCSRLAENQSLVQKARELLTALEDARFKNGTLNDDALKHFTLVLQARRNRHSGAEIYKTIHEQECVLITIIEVLSDRVEEEQIGEQMLRTKGDQNLKNILEVTKPAATVLSFFYAYCEPSLIYYVLLCSPPIFFTKSSPLMERVKVISVERNEHDSDDVINKCIREREEHDKWLMKDASPIQRPDEERTIMDLADDLKKITRLVDMAELSLASLHSFNPQDNGTLIYAIEHFDLVHKVLVDSDFIHLLFEN
ncbi:hypothetical protein OROMI_013838 [Orobanche minor]